MGADQAASGKQPGGQAITPPGLAVVLGRPADASRICRVDAPGRVLRIWALLNDAGKELHQVSLPPAAAARLQRQLDVLTGELMRSVSPALAGELRHIIGQGKAAAPTVDELRVEYASLLGWTGGLVIEMLSQIEVASAKVARSSHRTQPVVRGRAAEVEANPGISAVQSHRPHPGSPPLSVKQAR
jgi:hypothetical protein